MTNYGYEFDLNGKHIVIGRSSNGLYWFDVLGKRRARYFDGYRSVNDAQRSACRIAKSYMFGWL